MPASIKNRAFNVRISFDEAGEPIIGFIHSFYKVDSNCVDIRPVPHSTILTIAKKLGIEKSSNLLLVNRKAKKKITSSNQTALALEQA